MLISCIFYGRYIWIWYTHIKVQKLTLNYIFFCFEELANKSLMHNSLIHDDDTFCMFVAKRAGLMISLSSYFFLHDKTMSILENFKSVFGKSLVGNWKNHFSFQNFKLIFQKLMFHNCQLKQIKKSYIL